MTTSCARRRYTGAGIGLATFLWSVGACAPPREAAPPDSTVALDTTTPPRQTGPDTADIAFVVDLATRRVHVYTRDGDTLSSHAVAVGSAEWPTRTGSWTISQVVLNPEWVPPDESWAEERESKAPGAPDNPLGAAQLVYDLPRTIHGTNNPSSIGKAVSHGSLRVTNTDALSLSRLVMERTGVPDVPAKMEQAQRERTTKQIIELPQVVPIRVQ
jgi:lipoprotein-anchoring transpeptidase ErfK/SrfK